MQMISKSALKAKMLEHFRRIEESGEELIVTDHNRPVLRIAPIRARTPSAEIFSDVRGRVVYNGDVLEPTAEDWTER